MGSNILNFDIYWGCLLPGYILDSFYCGNPGGESRNSVRFILPANRWQSCHALLKLPLIAVLTLAAAVAVEVDVAFFTMQIEQFALLSSERDLHA